MQKEGKIIQISHRMQPKNNRLIYQNLNQIPQSAGEKLVG